MARQTKPEGNGIYKFLLSVWAVLTRAFDSFTSFFTGFTGKNKKRKPMYTGRINRRMPEEMQQVQETASGTDKTGRISPPKRKSHVAKRKRYLVQRLLLAVLSCFLLLALGMGIMVLYTTRNDDLWLNLDQIPYRGTTILYFTDEQTGEVFEYTRLPATQNKEYVESSQIPQTLKYAFVAVEDKNFYTHNGVSLGRTLFAVANELTFSIAGSYIGGEEGRKQGASTIDQQLIKNLTQDDKNSNLAGYLRKIREIARAYKMDATYDKDTIIGAYLNTISFTGSAAGVQAEAKKLFGKPVQELTLAECASLAAITRNPVRYNPVTNPEVHLQRRNYVLYEMAQQGYITEQEYRDAAALPLEVTGDTDTPYQQEVTSYFTDTIIDAVIESFVKERGLSRQEATFLLYNGGLHIYTTMVPELQSSMETALQSGQYYPRQPQTAKKQLTDEFENPLLDAQGTPVYGDVTVYPQAAMISLDYQGGICAVVGGLGQKEVARGFNRATSGARQVGSTMKPIGPYAVALEKDKITWSTPFYDGPVEQIEDEATGEMVDWPANATKVYSQKDVLVQQAFIESTNTVAVRVGETVGDDAMYKFVRDTLRIPTIGRADKGPGPLVLGSSTYGITPLELAKSYAIFGNGGQVYEPYCFTKITGGRGAVYLQTKKTAKQAITPQTAYIINRLMREVMLGNGSASGMSVRGEMDSVGKTGTTSEYRDHWFVGLTPYYVTASWYGYDENLKLGIDTHWRPPIIAWRAVMEQAQQDLPPLNFPVSDGIVMQEYCTVSGAQAGSNCPANTGYYKQTHLPEQTCPAHG